MTQMTSVLGTIVVSEKDIQRFVDAGWSKVETKKVENKKVSR